MIYTMNIFKVDDKGNLYIDMKNPFNLKEINTVIVGDEEHTEAINIAQLSNSQGSEVL